MCRASPLLLFSRYVNCFVIFLQYKLFNKNSFFKFVRISLFDGDTAQVGATNLIDASSANLAWHYDVNSAEFSYFVGRPATSRKKRGSMSWQGMIDSDLTNVVVNPQIIRYRQE